MKGGVVAPGFVTSVFAFSVDKGELKTCCVMPELPFLNPKVLAALLIPVYSEHQSAYLHATSKHGDVEQYFDFTTFFVNRSDTTLTHLEAFLYHLNPEVGEWVMIGSDRHVIVLEPKSIRVENSHGDGVHTVSTEDTLDFTALETKFVCILDESAQPIGLRFKSDSDEEVFVSHFRKMIALSSSKQDGGGQSFYDTDLMVCTAALCYTYASSPQTGEHTGAAPQPTAPSSVCAFGVCSPYPCIKGIKPLLRRGLKEFLSRPSASPVTEMLCACAHTCNFTPTLRDIVLAQNIPTYIQTVPGETLSKVVRFRNTEFPISVSVLQASDHVGECSLSLLVQTFGKEVLKILNALIMQRSILFLGSSELTSPAIMHPVSIDTVVQHVLASLKMVSPPLTRFVHRCFPFIGALPPADAHANPDLSPHASPGAITGTTSLPLADQLAWDVKANIVDGTVTQSPAFQELNAQSAVLDTQFYRQIENAMAGPSKKEELLCRLFQTYTQHIVKIGLAEEEFSSVQVKELELRGNEARVANWKQTHSFFLYAESRKMTTGCLSASAIRDIRRLLNHEDLSADELVAILTNLRASIVDADAFLALLAECCHEHCLASLFVPMLSQVNEVRQATCLFRRQLLDIQKKNWNVSFIKPNFFLDTIASGELDD